MLAEAADVSRVTIGKIERQEADTTSSVLLAIAKKLEVRMDDLVLGGSQSRTVANAINHFAASPDALRVKPTGDELALLATLPSAAWGGGDPTPGALMLLVLAMRG